MILVMRSIGINVNIPLTSKFMKQNLFSKRSLLPKKTFWGWLGEVMVLVYRGSNHQTLINWWGLLFIAKWVCFKNLKNERRIKNSWKHANLTIFGRLSVRFFFGLVAAWVCARQVRPAKCETHMNFKPTKDTCICSVRVYETLKPTW